MERRIFLQTTAATALILAFGFSRTASADYTEAEVKEARKIMDDMKNAGVEPERFVFPDPDKMTQADKDKLKRYRIFKIKNWKGLDADGKKKAIENIEKANENYFVCLPEGNIYAIADDDEFRKKIFDADKFPDDFLTEDEKKRIERERARSSSSSSNASEPAEKPGGGGGGD